MLKALPADRAAALAAAMSDDGGAIPRDPRGLAEYVAQCFEATVCFAAAPSRGTWRLLAVASNGAAAPAESELLRLLAASSAWSRTAALVATPSGDWTVALAPAAAAGRLLLLIGGDWRLHAPLLEAIQRRVRWRASSTSNQRNDIPHSALRLARRLSRVTGVRAVCGEALAAMAAALDARIGSIAIVEDADGPPLTIAATHGYSPLLVERVRINSGEGVVGRVFASGQPLFSDDGRMPPPSGRRRRYATAHFIAVPLRSRGQTIGVACAADPVDARPFTRRDVSSLLALAAPAATAIDRERAAARADAYAEAAAIDVASGLFNRRYFEIRIEEELQRSRRHDVAVTLLIADVDNFKTINDTYGHLAGDAVIRDLADILRRSVRVFDVCARFGGEEFAVIMPATDAGGAVRIAERIRDQLSAYRASDQRLAGVAVTLSIGIAASEPGMSARELIGRSDDALYEAKRAGKNRVSVAARPVA
jgi:diguanylate cyclase (GGDEF)-like protein